jgi:hypothetical protein
VFEMIKNINVAFGKPVKGKKVRKMKRLQRTLRLRSNQFFSDTYPIGKSLRLVMPSILCTLQRVSSFESIVGLLLDIPGKTKDGLNAHKDHQVLGIRDELHPQERPNGKVYLPLASYTLTNEEKRAICKCLCGIRVPTQQT